MCPHMAQRFNNRQRRRLGVYYGMMKDEEHIRWHCALRRLEQLSIVHLEDGSYFRVDVLRGIPISYHDDEDDDEPVRFTVTPMSRPFRSANIFNALVSSASSS
jgi:hypothetical protein